MKTLFSNPNNSQNCDNIPAANIQRFVVTHIRPGDSDEVVKDIITAPGEAAARMRAGMIFPGSRILAISTMPEPLPVRAKKDAPFTPSPGARFIRGIFRPALFAEDGEVDIISE
ncbi:MAG: hypothetical protein OEW37_07435 [Rhodospirillaceae bacterium]|nr:hypothetical protein [Rhodospirillaceae bacterium]